jgi:limonene-1,2-epoxide hydrolase
MAEQNESPTPEEQRNIAIAREFNACWSDRDCDRLMTLLDEEVAYMVYEGGPVHVGHAAVEGAVRPFLAKYERVEFEIVRMSAIGPVVSHERVEDYYGPGGKLDTHFHVVGLLVIKDGKIVLWRDYSYPGAEQIVGPLITQ